MPRIFVYSLSISDAPLANATYTVTVTDAIGCVSNTASVTVTINPGPSVTINGAPAGAICGGTTVNLGTTVTGGTGPFTYAWKKNGTALPATTASISDAPSASATYTVTVTDANGCASNTASVAVAVNPTPSVAITGAPSGICLGAAVNLGAAVTSGTAPFTYTWKKNGVALATTASLSDNPSANATYTVTVTDANGCVSNTASVIVTINPLPSVTITGAPTGAICAGTAVNLGTTVTGGKAPFTYSWTKAVGETTTPLGATTSSISDTPSVTTTYTVTVTDANGCAESVFVTVTVNPAPSAAITGAPSGAICAGTAVNLGTTVTGGTGPFTYNWMKNGTAFATTASLSDTPSLGGTTYTVKVTGSQGCLSNTAQVTVNVFNFTVAVTAGSPPTNSLLLGQSQQGSFTVTLTQAAGSATPPPMALSVSGLPAGIAGTFTSTSVTPTLSGASTTLTIAPTGATLPIGTYNLTITGTSPQGCTRTASAQLIVAAAGNPVAWGDNLVGQLGNGTLAFSNPPTPVNNLTLVTAISGGVAHSLAAKIDGTAWAWGDNSRGQLGNGTLVTSNVPVPVAGLAQVSAVAAGGIHSLAVKKDGTVWVWGDNSFGQLGLGTFGGSQPSPVQISSLTGVKAIAVGATHSVALRSDGTVWTWGDNTVGQLGSGTLGGLSASPILVSGLSGVTAIASFGVHTLALKADGTVWAWGDNHAGQLGSGSIGGSSAVPVQVTGLSGIQTIAAGAAHSLAQTSSGTVLAWGDNHLGQLGDGTLTTRSTPVPVAGLTAVTGLAAGGVHSLALKADGTVWAWGDNSTGQLGTGSFLPSLIPVPVPGLTKALLLAGGGAHSLAVLTPPLGP